MLEKYVYSFWWSVTTLVGKGLVFQPQTTIEQVCSIHHVTHLTQLIA